ncbi:MAG: DUF2391 family protein [Candidatus Pacearchaeota archaeon]
MEKNKEKGKHEIFVSFELKDIIQIIIGACILAVPIGFTEEAWRLGEILPISNIIFLLVLTLCFITLFTYYHYHKEKINLNPKHQITQLIKRVFATYIFSFLIVGIILETIKVTAWFSNFLLSFKRTIVITFPAAIGAVISDRI